MKTTFNNLGVILLLIFQVTACQKKPVVVPPIKEELCQIQQLTWKTGPYNEIDTATFKYNSVGNPVSVLISNVSTGNPHALFMYDKFNRLTDYIGSYRGFTDPSNMPSVFLYEYWYRFVYADENPSGLPVGDTVRVGGLYKDGKFEITPLLYTENFTYDSQNRIIKVNKIVSGVDQSETYNYDVNGNLIRPNATYDNRKNYRRTNKLWMLIDRNYSKNNPFTAITYNDAGFPTTFPASNPPIYNDNFLRRPMSLLTISYSCSIIQSGQ